MALVITLSPRTINELYFDTKIIILNTQKRLLYVSEHWLGFVKFCRRISEIREYRERHSLFIALLRP